MCEKEDNIFSIEELKWAKEMLNTLAPLKKEQQSAILWLMYHIGFLDIIASGRAMTTEEEQEWMERAMGNNDYILMTLILYKKTKDKD